MASGWKYTVAVPSWSQTQLRGDDAVVFYSIEVKLLPPEDLAHPARKHVVLRRFSHFQKLYLRLKEVHGAQLLAGIRLPPRLAMSNVAKHPELIDRRRGDLEQWLWRVVGNAELARSPLVLSFLELSEAARVIPHTPAVVPRPPAASQQQQQQQQQQQPTQPHHQQQQQQGEDGLPDPQHTGQQQERAHIVAGEVLGAASQQQRHMRLGFRIEQRMHLRKHLKLLQQQLDRAAAELQACL